MKSFYCFHYLSSLNGEGSGGEGGGVERYLLTSILLVFLLGDGGPPGVELVLTMSYGRL